MKYFWREYISPLIEKIGVFLEVVFFTTLPTLMGFLSAILDKKKNSVCYFVDSCYLNGEFLLYSIALLSSAYLTLKIRRNNRTSFLIVILMLVSICYTIVSSDHSNKIKVDPCWLLYISIIALAFSFWYTWYSTSEKIDKNHSLNEQNGNMQEAIKHEIKIDE